MVVGPQKIGQYLKYVRIGKLLIIGGRDIPDIVEASEKDRIERLEAEIARAASKKGQMRV
jgi:hypothetical protein